MNNRNQLANKGWAQMSTLLDEEMPHAKRRRYPMGWWLAVGVLLIVTGVFLNRSNSPVVEEEVPPATETGAQKQILSGSPTSNLPYQSNSVVRYTTEFAPEKKIETATLNRAISTPRFNGKPSTTGISPANNLHNTSVSGQTQFVKETERSLYRLINASALWAVKSDFGQMGPPIVRLCPVVPKPVASIPLPNPPIAAAVTTIAKKRLRYYLPRLSFGLMTGANAFQVKQEAGLLGGLVVDINVPHHRLGIQTGLIYRYQRYSGESRPVIPVTYDRYLRSTGNTDIQPSQLPAMTSWYYISANNRVLVPVMKSHQLEIPALLSLQLNPHWRLYGGMTVLRHVWIESASKSLFTYELKVITTDGNKAQGNLNSAITSQLPKWERNWQTGFSYKFYRHFEIGMFYRSVKNGIPVISDINSLFASCKTCDDKYPAAKQGAKNSIRPQSLQINATLKF